MFFASIINRKIWVIDKKNFFVVRLLWCLCLISIYFIILVCYRNGVLCFTCIIMVVISIFRNIHKLIEVFLVF